MNKNLINIFYLVIAILIANIDVILGIDFNIIGDRKNYLDHVSDNPVNSEFLFTLLNLDYLWYQLLGILKFITFGISDNLVLRMAVFISSITFLHAFYRRTKSFLIPIFIILIPGVIDFFVVKLRHGLALSLFAYLNLLSLMFGMKERTSTPLELLFYMQLSHL